MAAFLPIPPQQSILSIVACERYARLFTSIDLTPPAIQSAAHAWKDSFSLPNLERIGNLYLQGRHFWNSRREPTVRQGIECFKRAVEIGASYALAYTGLVEAYWFLVMYGFIRPAEAYSQVKVYADKAIELDKDLSEALRSGHDEAFLRVGLGRRPCSIHALHRVEPEECLRPFLVRLEKVVETAGRLPIYLGFLGGAYGIAGRTSDARKIAAELEVQRSVRYIQPTTLALLYSGLREKEATLRWLEQAYAERDPLFLTMDPQIDFVRDDPQFQKLLVQMKLPPFGPAS